MTTRPRLITSAALALAALAAFGCRGDAALTALERDPAFEALPAERQALLRVYAHHQSPEAAREWLAAGADGPLVVRAPALRASLGPEAAEALAALDEPLREGVLASWPAAFGDMPLGPIPARLGQYTDGYARCAARVWSDGLRAIPPGMRSAGAWLGPEALGELEAMPPRWRARLWRAVAADLFLALTDGPCSVGGVDAARAERLRSGAAESLKQIRARLPVTRAARALIEHPIPAWWFDDVDLRAQAWLSIHGTLDKFIYGTPPDTMAWRRPGNPSRPWERYAQKPYGNQNTSTLHGPYLTSELLACDERVGDYRCEFPLAWWSICFLEDVRVFEIHGPADWHDLCVRYPARGTEDDRLVPNWGAVSEEWDGVHLSLGGLLTAEQNRFESPAGWRC